MFSSQSAQAWLGAFVLLAGSVTCQAGDPVAGRQTYVTICSSCHGMNGIGNLEYVPSFRRCEGLDKEDAVLLVSVRDGLGARMPPWGGYLSETEILDALAFARTFCKR